MCELKTQGTFVGQCGIVPQTVEERREMEIAYLFVRAHWGKGLATEAATAVKACGFTTMGRSRLSSMIYKPNLPSIGVA
ncbi:GNAT family N-acetyltransferase, partial [Brevibacillus sp. SIMBA_076]|uniref:GNAT family N-acetyltransferase n=1 Tax=Brevibacillus sp. SIMBA_076 TaxID=3085814 RepID=UPI00397A50CB